MKIEQATKLYACKSWRGSSKMNSVLQQSLIVIDAFSPEFGPTLPSSRVLILNDAPDSPRMKELQAVESIEETELDWLSE
jgi:hypothetical protein